MENQWFNRAETIADLHEDYYEADGGSWMRLCPGIERDGPYDQLLLEPSIPPLIRAKSLAKQGQILTNYGKSDIAEEKNREAERIFREQEHTSGVLLMELERLVLMPMPSAAEVLIKRLARIREIKHEFETVGNWTSVFRAIQHMFGIATYAMPDTELGERLYKESLEVPGLSPSSVVWKTWQLEVFSTFQLNKADMGKSLDSVGQLYESVKDSEAPLIKARAAALLSQINKELGNNAEAIKWESRAQFADKDSWYFGTSFQKRLELITSFSSLEEEMGLLTEALQRLAEKTSYSMQFGWRHLAIIKMYSIADIYIDQTELRGMDSTRKLVQYCLNVIEPLLERLLTKDRQNCAGKILEIKARLLINDACQGTHDSEARLLLIRQGIAAREKVLTYFKELDEPMKVGTASSLLASSYKILWGETGRSPSSPSFYAAAKLYDEAGVLLQKYGTTQLYRKNVQLCLQLWIEGYNAWLQTPQRLRDSLVSPVQEVKRHLEHLERIIDRQRNDLSFLEAEQAISAKQAMRNSEDVHLLYNASVVFFGVLNDRELMWRTIQKSKARSISDRLGLGINLPQELATRIEEDMEAKALLEREHELLTATRRDATDGQLRLRQQLDSHRSIMRCNPCLREMLELREGTPVDLSRLQALMSNFENHERERRIICVDYFIVAGNIHLITIHSDRMPIINNLRVRAELVSEWKEQHFQLSQLLNDNDDDISKAIESLFTLVHPLENLSKEGDLIVLCASGVLHDVPLHAAPISQGSEESLIDRNPIVYCPSMTVFNQCVTRACTETQSNGKNDGQALLAIYETPNGDDWETQRADAYEIFANLAEEIPGARVLTGPQVNNQQFKRECERAKIVHFFGHCEKGAEDSNQHLVLAAPNQTPTINTRASDAEQDFNVVHLVPTMPFTISDIFSTSVHASHINLIACGSASQIISQGDEPWGIVTALLCAGATSVAGTMWPIQVGTGERFMQTLYKKGLKQGYVEERG